MNNTLKENGFTLMELMIVVVIVGILGAIAYPTYTDHMIKSRRVDGQTALYNLATMMEHFYTENNTYVGATLGTFGFTANSSQGYYQISITSQTATSFTLSATPTAGGPQTQDTTCGTLTLTNTNVKAPNPTTCWN